jgi:hypothetical protein
VSAGLANAPDFNQGAQLALHLASLAHQLQQFYAGAALAAALGRVLVLPNFQCYCFRDAGSLLRGSDSDGASSRGWSCRAPGDDNSVFPFNCTLDQVWVGAGGLLVFWGWRLSGALSRPDSVCLHHACRGDASWTGTPNPHLHAGA